MANNQNAHKYNQQFQEMFSFFNPKNANFNVIDFQKIQQLHQRNIDSLTQANKALFEGAQKIAKSQAEFFQEQAQTAASVASKALSARTPEESLDAHARFAQHAFDAGLQNLQNAAKSASNTSVVVLEIINDQAAQNLREFANTAKKAGANN